MCNIFQTCELTSTWESKNRCKVRYQISYRLIYFFEARLIYSQLLLQNLNYTLITHDHMHVKISRYKRLSSKDQIIWLYSRTGVFFIVPNFEANHAFLFE